MQKKNEIVLDKTANKTTKGITKKNRMTLGKDYVEWIRVQLKNERRPQEPQAKKVVTSPNHGGKEAGKERDAPPNEEQETPEADGEVDFSLELDDDEEDDEEDDEDDDEDDEDNDNWGSFSDSFSFTFNIILVVFEHI